MNPNDTNRPAGFLTRAFATAICVGLALLFIGLAAPSAKAELSIENFAATTSTGAAGAHPDATTSFSFAPISSRNNLPSGGVPRDLIFKLPPGFLANAQGIPQCPIAAFESVECPQDTQIGSGSVNVTFVASPLAPATFPLALYNLPPRPGEPAEFGLQPNITASPGSNPVVQRIMVPTVSAAENYAVSLHLPEIPVEITSLLGSTLTIWGVPADHNEGGGPRIPFIDNPTDCTAFPTTTFLADTYGEPATYATATAQSPIPTDCASVPFNPSIQLVPDSNKADSPTGLSFDLNLPQNNDPNGQRTSDLKKAVAKLPPGMTLSPPSADGLGGCSPSQIGIGNDEPANCPEDSRIGTAEVDSPILPTVSGTQSSDGTEGALKGSVYVGEPENGLNTKPPYPVYVDLQGHGLEIKLKGTVEPDPQTGQITTTFDNNPELPFDHFILHFKGGPRAPLVTPSSCGRQTITTEMTPYSEPGEPATPPSSFETSYDGKGAPCPAKRPFSPAVSAGVENPAAGKTTSFHVHLTQPDGNQPIEAITITPPPGFAAYLGGVPFCPESAIAAATARSGQAEQASPSCPAASKLGTVTAAAGAGESPLYVSGNVYLSGPYKNAPLSTVAITPAVAGPFDLGDVVVRSALYVNPETAQLTIKTDPIPHILGGTPLQLRSIEINVDRPHFSLNPTSCNRMAITTTVQSIYGTEANLSNPFQVGGCAALPFKPKIVFRLKGGTRRADHPAFTATLTAKTGEANIARAQVSLPHSEFLDQAHIQTVCTRVQFAEGSTPGEKCPAASIYGYARAVTPLLEAPAEGPVYLRSSSNPLPDLVATLNGEIDVALDGRVDTDQAQGIRNSFEVIPDAPVSKFTLSLAGGRKGLLINSTNLCAKPNYADAKFSGQNGKAEELHPVMQVSCGGKKGRRSHNGARGLSRLSTGW